MSVLGIDPSLSGTGLAIIDAIGVANGGEALVTKLIASGPSPSVLAAVQTGRKERRVAHLANRLKRNRDIVDEALFWTRTNIYSGLELIVIEAPSPGSRNATQQQHERSGLFWMLLDDLVDYHACRVVEVAPKTRAKYAAGDGAANKASVVNAMVERYKLSSRNDNIADAVALADMGARQLGHPLVSELPAANLAAMKSVLWTNERPR